MADFLSFPNNILLFVFDYEDIMKYEDFINRLEEIRNEHPEEDLEVVIYDEIKRYIEPVATVLPVGNSKKIVIM